MQSSQTISEEDRKKFREIFDFFDKNKNGEICFDELCAGMKKLGMEYTKLELRYFMKEWDTDKSGEISFEEFLRFVTKPPTEMRDEDSLRTLFDFMDENGDGFISKQEFFKINTEIVPGFTRTLSDDIFDKGDTNKDGLISFDEFAKMTL